MCLPWSYAAYLFMVLLELGLLVRVVALQLAVDMTLVLEQHLGLLEGPRKRLFGLVELPQLTLGLLQLLLQVGHLRLRPALGALQLLYLAL